MCVSACMYVRTLIFVHVKAMSREVLSHSLPYLTRRDLSLDLTFTKSSRLAGQEVPGSLCLHLLSTKIINLLSPHPFLESELRPSWLYSKYLKNRAGPFWWQPLSIPLFVCLFFACLFIWNRISVIQIILNVTNWSKSGFKLTWILLPHFPKCWD